MSQTTTQQSEHDGRADFDFLIGRWNVHHRRLRERLKGSTSWEAFEGISATRTILGRLGNLDEVILYREAGPVEALTLRFFDPKAAQWSIYWADSTNGFQPPPVIGGFKEGRGEFYSQEAFEGKSIFCRFIWSNITPTSCRWEQAFSTDGGKTWETNWIMEFTRQQEEQLNDECQGKQQR
jgi:hypothetical protein